MMQSVKKISEEPRLQQLHDLKFATLNQLAAGTAHEFNNLIAGILGSAEIIALDLPEKHPARESLTQIFEATHRAREFVIKLRELAQRNPAELKSVRLQNIIEDALPILRTVISAKVQLHAQVDSTCPPVAADSAQIQQAVIELCLQCWHGLPDRSGEITISLEKFPVEKISASSPPANTSASPSATTAPASTKIPSPKSSTPFTSAAPTAKKSASNFFSSAKPSTPTTAKFLRRANPATASPSTFISPRSPTGRQKFNPAAGKNSVYFWTPSSSR